MSAESLFLVHRWQPSLIAGVRELAQICFTKAAIPFYERSTLLIQTQSPSKGPTLHKTMIQGAQISTYQFGWNTNVLSIAVSFLI